ncbi:hypothetical protein [Mycolicibacterium baixiangningiae]|nr:hypothetical protein [Mycolicibacterium baixiangningiae]
MQQHVESLDESAAGTIAQAEKNMSVVNIAPPEPGLDELGSATSTCW